MTTRQRQTARLADKGFSNKQIARELGISPSTVKNHLGAARRIVGASPRGALWHRLAELAW